MKNQRRQLGVAAAIAVVTGESTALGIFLTPASMAKALGSPFLLAMAWSATACMALCGALCYSELAIRFPQAGGEYVYLRYGYGERIAFLYGWMSATVMDPGVTAALVVGAVAYVQIFVPLGRHVATLLLPGAILMALATINYFGTRLSGSVMATANFLKFALLFALVGWALLAGKGSIHHLAPFAIRRAGSEALFPAIASTMVAAFFSFGGWWEAGKLAGEIRNPEKNLPRAFIGGVLLVTAVYILISFAFLYVVPLENVVSNTTFVAQFGSALFGGAGEKILSVCVLISVFGGLMALTMAAPRVYYAMACDGALFPAFGRLHPRFGTPVNAILLQTGMALLLLTLGAFDHILAYIIFSAVIFLGLSAASLFRLERPVVRWWYPAAPIVFLLGCFSIGVLILMHYPMPALLGLGIVLAGDLLRRLFFTARPAEHTAGVEPTLS
ncbi:MAG TPA: amino acid permease [Acidobacteriaceae bacterium]|nr:amino acid permease [Acidobacteriaceae bacterium]